MVYRSIKIIRLPIIFLVIDFTICADPKSQSLLTSESEKGGWSIFGHGLLDSGYSQESGELKINVNWAVSKWGIGGAYTLDTSIDGRELDAIRMEAKSEGGTKPKVVVGISTKEDANLVIPIDKAVSINDEWQSLLFDIKDMVDDKPEETSKVFDNENDWEKIQIIKFLVLKPDGKGDEQNDILLRNPELIYQSTETQAD